MPLKSLHKQLSNKLAALYPDARSELNFKNEYELIVAVILSAQCTDKRVNIVTPKLFAEFPTFESLAKADVAEVTELVNQINYYKTKAKNLVGMAQMVVSNFSGKLPTAMVDLEKLPGVGRKTASVVIVESGGAALPVDTHVFRVSRRLGIASGADVVAVENQLRAAFPSDSWRLLHHWLIFHGRRVCHAIKPKCTECTLSSECENRADLPQKPVTKRSKRQRKKD
jgi:endonuclease-3